MKDMTFEEFMLSTFYGEPLADLDKEALQKALYQMVIYYENLLVWRKEEQDLKTWLNNIGFKG